MLSTLIFIFLLFSISPGVEISSKIDLDSEEQSADSSLNLNPIIISIKNEPETPKNIDFRQWGSKSNFGTNFHSRNFGALPRSRNNHGIASRPRVVKNIHICVNGKDLESDSGSVKCHENICETTVMMDKKDEDDEIVSISVKVVTRPKSPKIEDVPVFEGVRATGFGDSQRTPTFLSNNIGLGPRRNPSWTFSYRPRNFRPVGGSSSWNPRIPGKIPIDDKIESPLSKTDHAVQ